MWEPFSEEVRQAITLAQEESARLGDNFIGTEHLLLGLLAGGPTPASEALESMGISLEKIRSEVRSFAGDREEMPRSGVREMVFSAQAKRTIELSFEEARNLSQRYIGAEHLLLGLLASRESVAGRILEKLGVHPRMLRAQVMGKLGRLGATRLEPVPEPNPVPVQEPAPVEVREPALRMTRTDLFLVALKLLGVVFILYGAVYGPSIAIGFFFALQGFEPGRSASWMMAVPVLLFFLVGSLLLAFAKKIAQKLAIPDGEVQFPDGLGKPFFQDCLRLLGVVCLATALPRLGRSLSQYFFQSRYHLIGNPDTGADLVGSLISLAVAAYLISGASRLVRLAYPDKPLPPGSPKE